MDIVWENSTPSTELPLDFCAGIGPLQLGVVLVLKSFNTCTCIHVDIFFDGWHYQFQKNRWSLLHTIIYFTTPQLSIHSFLQMNQLYLQHYQATCHYRWISLLTLRQLLIYKQAVHILDLWVCKYLSANYSRAPYILLCFSWFSWEKLIWHFTCHDYSFPYVIVRYGWYRSYFFRTLSSFWIQWHVTSLCSKPWVGTLGWPIHI